MGHQPIVISRTVNEGNAKIVGTDIAPRVMQPIEDSCAIAIIVDKPFAQPYRAYHIRLFLISLRFIKGQHRVCVYQINARRRTHTETIGQRSRCCGRYQEENCIDRLTIVVFPHGCKEVVLFLSNISDGTRPRVIIFQGHKPVELQFFRLCSPSAEDTRIDTMRNSSGGTILEVYEESILRLHKRAGHQGYNKEDIAFHRFHSI